MLCIYVCNNDIDSIYIYMSATTKKIIINNYRSPLIMLALTGGESVQPVLLKILPDLHHLCLIFFLVALKIAIIISSRVVIQIDLGLNYGGSHIYT